MGYHERNNLSLWLMFNPQRIMDSHPNSTMELCGRNLEGLESMWMSWHPSSHEILGKNDSPTKPPSPKKRLGPLPDDSPDPYPLLIGFFLGWRQVDVTLMHTELISISWLFKRCSQKRDKSWNPEMLQLMSLDTTQCTDPKTSQAADRIFSKSSKELPNCAPKPTRINENRSCEDLWDTQNLTLRFEDRNT